MRVTPRCSGSGEYVCGKCYREVMGVSSVLGCMGCIEIDQGDEDQECEMREE